MSPTDNPERIAPGFSRVMKRVFWREKRLKIANDFVIPVDPHFVQVRA
jgi:hypothetical protein